MIQYKGYVVFVVHIFAVRLYNDFCFYVTLWLGIGSQPDDPMLKGLSVVYLAHLGELSKLYTLVELYLTVIGHSK